MKINNSYYQLGKLYVIDGKNYLMISDKKILTSGEIISSSNFKHILAFKYMNDLILKKS